MVTWLVVCVVAAFVCFVTRLLHYPGRREHLFGREHHQQRRTLARARGVLRALQARKWLEVMRAHGNVARARSEYKRRITRIEGRLEHLRTPEPGDREDVLGPIERYTHTLIWQGRPLELAGLRMRHEAARSSTEIYVYITEVDGTEHLTCLEHQHAQEDRVRRFCVETNNAAAREKRRQAQRDHDIAGLEAELAEAREATEPIEHAENEREQTRALHESQPRLPQARKALDDARDAWQQLTGRRPLL